ncbi:hypothetical protein [Rhizobium sp. 22-785-1]
MTLPDVKLPARPLILKRGVLSVPFAYYFSPPILLAIAIFMFVAEGPGIIRDYKISQNPVEIENGDLNGSCKTRKGIFTTCTAKLAYDYEGKHYISDVEVMFIDIHSGDYEAGLVISGSDPALATISLGLDMLWNRIITLAVLTVLLGFGGLALMMALVRYFRARAKLGEAQPLILLPVALINATKKRGGVLLTYSDTIREDKTKRQSFSLMRKDEVPLIIGQSEKHDIALATWQKDSPLPVLLDDRLERIEMTEAERAQALSAFTSDEVSPGAPQTDRAQANKTVGASALQGIKAFGIIILLMIVGIGGYWLWYVTAAPSQFTSPAMDINNLMPGPINKWGCAQLQKRFGEQNAPFGCASSDYTSWK